MRRDFGSIDDVRLSIDQKKIFVYHTSTTDNDELKHYVSTYTDTLELQSKIELKEDVIFQTISYNGTYFVNKDKQIKVAESDECIICLD